MNTNELQNNYLEKLKDIHKNFSLSTGLTSVIIYKNGRILSEHKTANTFCNRFTFDRNNKYIQNVIINQLHLIQQKFINLITNAIKVGKKDATVIIQLKRIDESLLIAVIDEGSGINDADKEKITNFSLRSENPFIRGKDAARCIGGGLGFYIAAKTILAHKWKPLEINNRSDKKGCVVSFLIPNIKECPHEIIVIDDEVRVLEEVRNYLQRESYTVKTFNTIEAADAYILRSARENKISLIIVDVMNNNAGLISAENWNSRFGCRILLISNRQNINSKFPFILKPFGENRFIDEFNHALKGK